MGEEYSLSTQYKPSYNRPIHTPSAALSNRCALHFYSGVYSLHGWLRLNIESKNVSNGPRVKPALPTTRFALGAAGIIIKPCP